MLSRHTTYGEKAMTRHGGRRLLIAGITAGLLAGCGGGKSPLAASPTPSSDAPTTPGPSETLSAPTETPTETPTESPAEEQPPAATSTGPVVLGSNASGRELKLADVFSADGTWEESRYDVATRRDIQGMGVTLDSCGEYAAAQLELRLAQNFKKLTLSVGQANNSPSSDQKLVVEIVANGRQLDIRRIPFDRIQPFTENVAGVNALKLRFWIDADQCTGDIVAVVEKLTVSG
jgi:hypothetical protein